MTLSPLFIVAGLWIWMLIAIAVHETCHILAGIAVGFRPTVFSVGSGPTILRTKVCSVTVHLRIVPRHGFVRAARRYGPNDQWREVIFALAGPVSNAAVLLALWQFTPVSESFESLDLGWWRPLAGVAFLFQSLLVLGSILPRDVNLDGAVVPNDTKQAWEAMTGVNWRKRSSQIEAYRRSIARYDPQFDFTHSWIHEADPLALMELAQGYQHLVDKQYDEDLRLLGRVLAQSTLVGAERAALLDQMAWCVAIGGEKRFLRQALDWVQEAITLLPNAPTLNGTLGSLLVEAGNYSRGIGVLQPLTEPANEPIDRAISSCYIAKAQHHLGNTAEAEALLQVGLSLGTSAGVCERIQAEIGANLALTKSQETNTKETSSDASNNSIFQL